ncbi:MAG: TIGR04283 family arsenosugar biosynthesis glycosyltransferase [Gammaproteobacteria bacterium]
MPESSRISASIIIPVFNESSELDSTLEQLSQSLQGSSDIEVIISDGGSTDNSPEIAKHYPCRVINTSTGRANQMNAASAHARGNWLVFLHADSQLPDNWQAQLRLSNQWGFFPVKLSGEHWPLSIVESLINLRSRVSKVATGDQGLYFRRSFFQELGGYPDIPIMEDVAISKLARQKSTPSIGAHPVMTSSRRWQQNGIIKTVLLMWSLRLAYFLGINPVRLHRIYYPNQS